MSKPERLKRLEFWFEFASPYSYLSAARIAPLADEKGVQVAYRPFLLGPIFAAQGWNDSPFNIYPAKGAYLVADMAREAAALDLPYAMPSTFPRGSLLAARIACAHSDKAWTGAFVRAVFHANFAEDRAIDEPSVIAELLERLGLDASAIIAKATRPEAKAALREQTEEAMRKGIFGAPSFYVQGALFWGNDRLERALAHD